MKIQRFRKYRIIQNYKKLSEQCGFDGATRPSVFFFDKYNMPGNPAAVYAPGTGFIGINVKGLFGKKTKALKHELKHAEQEVLIFRLLGLNKFKTFFQKDKGIDSKIVNEDYFEKACKKFGPLQTAEEVKRAERLMEASINYPSVEDAILKAHWEGKSRLKAIVNFYFNYRNNLAEKEARKASRRFFIF